MTRSRLLAALALIGGIAVLTTWALSAPTGSSPDDGRHLPSIWCAHGEKTGICAYQSPSHAGGMVIVPAALASAQFCYAGNTSTSAACQPFQDVPLSKQDRALADASFLYQTPALFYWTMNWLVNDNLEQSVMRVRLANILLASTFVLLAGMLATGWVRIGVLLGWLIAPIPLGLSIIPSTNPSAWAIIGIGTYWALLLAHWQAKRPKRRIAAGVAATAAAILAIGGRTDSAAYVVLVSLAIVALHWLPRWRELRSSYLLLVVPIAACAAALVVFLTRPQSSVAVDGMGGAPATDSAIGLLLRNVFDLPALWLGNFGQWPLGYFDIPLPIYVVFAVGTAFFAVVFLGLRHLDWSKTVGLLIVFAGVSALPLWIYQRGHLHVGQELQPRYFLPLFFVLLGIAVAAPYGTRFLNFTRPQRIVLVIVLTAAATISLVTQMRRYTVGDGQTQTMFSSPEWWSQSWISPSANIAIGLVGFAIWATCALLLLPREEHPAYGSPLVTADDALSTAVDAASGSDHEAKPASAVQGPDRPIA